MPRNKSKSSSEPYEKHDRQKATARVDELRGIIAQLRQQMALRAGLTTKSSLLTFTEKFAPSKDQLLAKEIGRLEEELAYYEKTINQYASEMALRQNAQKLSEPRVAKLRELSQAIDDLFSIHSKDENQDFIKLKKDQKEEYRTLYKELNTFDPNSAQEFPQDIEKKFEVYSEKIIAFLLSEEFQHALHVLTQRAMHSMGDQKWQDLLVVSIDKEVDVMALMNNLRVIYKEDKRGGELELPKDIRDYITDVQKVYQLSGPKTDPRGHAEFHEARVQRQNSLNQIAQNLENLVKIEDSLNKARSKGAKVDYDEHAMQRLLDEFQKLAASIEYKTHIAEKGNRPT